MRPALAAAGSALCLALFAGGARADLTQARLAEIVKKALQKGTVAVEEVAIQETADHISVDLGGVKRAAPVAGEDALEPPARKPLEYPIDVQFQVEIIRKYAAGGRRRFWQPYLAKLEDVVGRELALIARHRGRREDLLRQLERCDREAEDVLDAAVADLVKRSGKPRSMFAQAPQETPLRFKTNPDGASVFYLTVVDYEAAKELGVEGKLQTWTEVPSRRAVLPYGYYYFFARWPDGKTRMTGKVKVADNQEVLLSAN
jgi:hypothetical protein